MTQIKKAVRGRPRSEAAASHETILDAVYELLHEKSVRNLTIEEVAKRAGVGKPTIYKWWPSKAALVMDMFEERVVESLAAPAGMSAEETFRTQMRAMMKLFNGFFGKVAAEIIAEGQSEPEVLREYCERYMFHRRAFSIEVIAGAKSSGEFRKDVDPEILIDMIYGPIYYRLLVKHHTFDESFGDELVRAAMLYARA
jgi:AcrR family transcriptional regulator